MPPRVCFEGELLSVRNPLADSSQLRPAERGSRPGGLRRLTRRGFVRHDGRPAPRADRRRAHVGALSRFVASDTGARVGENRIDPHDERIASFAHDVATPAFRDLGASVSIDELNNVVARFGPDEGMELLSISYPALHHARAPQRARARPRTSSPAARSHLTRSRAVHPRSRPQDASGGRRGCRCLRDRSCARGPSRLARKQERTVTQTARPRSLSVHGVLDLPRRDELADLDVRDLDPPAARLLIEPRADELVDPFPLRKNIVEGDVADHGAQGRRRQPDRLCLLLGCTSGAPNYRHLRSILGGLGTGIAISA